MRLLLDTHTVLWWGEGKLPAKVVARARSADEVFVSAASAWEVAIKAGLGKIAVRGTFSDAVVPMSENGQRGFFVRASKRSCPSTKPLATPRCYGATRDSTACSMSGIH